MFKKVLIANRGEIAIRIIRSCRELGIETVAVHSDVDEESLHVKIADESVCIGPRSSQDSYLNMKSIISAAEITGADAVHPGYGFLSENFNFSNQLSRCGIKFIGPHVKALELMGDKIKSKKFATECGVPVLKTLEVKILDSDFLSEVEKLGFPVLLKASAGGGGKGMAVVDSLKNLESTFSRLSHEAKVSFGDGTIFIEPFLQNPRHIEVQVLGDKFGNIVHLGERDCSIQRNYQKLIEESPSPILNNEKREEVYDYALKIARAIQYDSVGTVEFLFDQDTQKFYFIEMNTRIQVEHPVTEERYKVDLISEQIKVASEEKLKISQESLIPLGHVIECRINAEDSEKFLPCPGLIDHYHRPGGLGVRVDDFIYTGYTVNPFYDSMISKIIVSAKSREECIKRLKRCLSEMIVSGIKTNREFHLEILNTEDFVSGNYSTNYLKERL